MRRFCPREEPKSWAGEALLADLRLPMPRERYLQLVSYLEGVIVHQLTFPGEPLDSAPGFRAILMAGLGREAE